VTTVAIVDDHTMFADGLSGLLNSQAPHLQVTITASSWPELLAHPAFPTDVTLLDLDLADRIPPRVKIATLLSAGSVVVMVSGSAVPAAVLGCLDAGAKGYVPKTDMSEQVIEAITDAVAGRVHLSPALAAVLESASPPTALSDQEARVLALYAAGLPLKSVARQLNIGYESAKTYLDRIREKYAQAGRDARTKLDLRLRAAEDGHLPPDL
jgi:DNA-binding NarL/FixJ family response regulator